MEIDMLYHLGGLTVPDLIAHPDSLDASKIQSILNNIGGLDLETKFIKDSRSHQGYC